MTKPPNTTERRIELEKAVADAEAQAHTVRQQAQAAHNRVAELREQLAARPPDEYAPDGSVRPKTEASKLYAQLQTAEHPPVAWERREQDAQNGSAQPNVRSTGSSGATSPSS